MVKKLEDYAEDEVIDLDTLTREELLALGFMPMSQMIIPPEELTPSQHAMLAALEQEQTTEPQAKLH